MNDHDVKILQKIILHAQKVMAYIKECSTYECFAADEMRKSSANCRLRKVLPFDD